MQLYVLQLSYADLSIAHFTYIAITSQHTLYLWQFSAVLVKRRFSSNLLQAMAVMHARG